jgi:hypothetical protein
VHGINDFWKNEIDRAEPSSFKVESAIENLKRYTVKDHLSGTLGEWGVLIDRLCH